MAVLPPPNRPDGSAATPVLDLLVDLAGPGPAERAMERFRQTVHPRLRAAAALAAPGRRGWLPRGTLGLMPDAPPASRTAELARILEDLAAAQEALRADLRDLDARLTLLDDLHHQAASLPERAAVASIRATQDRLAAALRPLIETALPAWSASTAAVLRTLEAGGPPPATLAGLGDAAMDLLSALSRADEPAA